MSAVLATTLGGLVARLEARVNESAWPAPEAAFAGYVLAATPAHLSDELAALPRRLLEAAIAQTETLRWDEAPVLAAAGYLLGDMSDAGLVDRWLAGAERLAGRDAFPPDRASFFYRPVELLGLAKGAASFATDDRRGNAFRSWLAGVLRDGEGKASTDVWHRALGVTAAAAVGEPWSMPIGPADVSGTSIDELALLCWLAVADSDVAVGPLGNEARARSGELERDLLRRALLEPVNAEDAARAAVIVAALRYATERTLESAHAVRWQIDRSQQDVLQLLETLCGRFPRYARQLAERRDGRTALAIDDEYDLQDALNALLRLHFDDVRAEEWVPSYGGSRTRMDFLLKREQTVIETKMTRDRLDQRKVVEELVIDKAHYRQHPDCRTLVCFVYDPEDRLDNPDALVGDLSDDVEGLLTRVVVSPRPS